MLHKQKRTRGLFGAVLLFILLDLSVLVINYWVAYQVSQDAVAINLSGRQRMLTQRMTKSLLQLQSPGAHRVAVEQEFLDAAQMFDRTLLAFERGGMTVGGDGTPVELQRVGSDQARELIEQANIEWQPLRDRLRPCIEGRQPVPVEVLDFARQQMVDHNLKLLGLMNRLASHLENDSKERANLLRLVQSLVFVLALINFVAIVRGFHLLARQAEQASEFYGDIAMRDPLTGLFNRRQFNEALEREIASANRRGSCFTLLLLDLDGFKPVNDRYGHHAGDAVLRAVAERLGSQARSNDTVARIGGDEFVLICPDLCDESSAALVSERLLNLLNEEILLETATVRIGASIGIAFYPNHAHTVDDLIRAADEAMYLAKKAGRNRCAFAGASA